MDQIDDAKFDVKGIAQELLEAGRISPAAPVSSSGIPMARRSVRSQRSKTTDEIIRELGPCRDGITLPDLGGVLTPSKAKYPVSKLRGI